LFWAQLMVFSKNRESNVMEKNQLRTQSSVNQFWLPRNSSKFCKNKWLMLRLSASWSNCAGNVSLAFRDALSPSKLTSSTKPTAINRKAICCTCLRGSLSCLAIARTGTVPLVYSQIRHSRALSRQWGWWEDVFISPRFGSDSWSGNVSPFGSESLSFGERESCASRNMIKIASVADILKPVISRAGSDAFALNSYWAFLSWSKVRIECKTWTWNKTFSFWSSKYACVCR